MRETESKPNVQIVQGKRCYILSFYLKSVVDQFVVASRILKSFLFWDGLTQAWVHCGLNLDLFYVRPIVGKYQQDLIAMLFSFLLETARVLYVLHLSSP